MKQLIPSRLFRPFSKLTAVSNSTSRRFQPSPIGQTGTALVTVVGAMMMLCTLPIAGHPLDNLKLEYPLPSNASYNDVAYGAGKFITVSSSGRVFTTDDGGATWTEANVGFNITLLKIIFGGGRFVAGGNNFGTGVYAVTSTNGVDWIATDLAPTNSAAAVQGLAFGNNRFVAVFSDGSISTSDNGINWMNQNSMTTQNLRDVTYGNGLFVAVGATAFTDHTILTSDDGINWMNRTNPGTARLNGVTFGDGLFVAVGHSSNILSSANGTDWTFQNAGKNTVMFDVAFGDGAFIAYGQFAEVLKSTNGSDWVINPTQPIPSGFLDGGIYGNGQFMIIGGSGIQTSPDEENWTLRSSAPQFVPSRSEFADGLFVGMTSGQVGTSIDGVAWTTQDTAPTGFTGFHSDMTQGKGRFFVCGRRSSDFLGYILSSTNGEDWNAVYQTPNVGGLYGITEANNQMLASGDSGWIVFSDDGQNWTLKPSGTTYYLKGITHGNGRYVAVGRQSFAVSPARILTSPDGNTWIDADPMTTNTLNDIIFMNGLFVAVGEAGTIITSPNGTNWTVQSTGGYAGNLDRIKFLNKEFLVSPLISQDGTNWTQHSGFADVVFTGTHYFVHAGSAIFSAVAGGATIGEFTDIQFDGMNVIVTWTGDGDLEFAPGIGAGWQPMNGVTSPFTNAPNGLMGIFRLSLP
jgi:hypothetical protein